MKTWSAFEFICQCLATADDPLSREAMRRRVHAQDLEWERIIELTSQRGVILHLYSAFAAKNLLGELPEDVREFLSEMHQRNGERNRRILAELSEVGRLLNALRITPIAIKGAGNLAAGLYQDPAIRWMDDIDLVVPEDRLAESFQALLQAGYREIPDTRSLCHEPTLWHPQRAAAIELHGHTHADDWGPVLDENDMRHRATVLPGLEGDVLVPCATDRAIIAVAHFHSHHGVPLHRAIPLRDLLDLILLDAQSPDAVDWGEVLNGFGRSQAPWQPHLCLMLMERLLGHARPAGVSLPPFAALRWYSCVGPFQEGRLWRWTMLLWEEIHSARTLWSDTPHGKLRRANLLNPRWYWRHLVSAKNRLRVSAPPRV